MFSMVQAFLIMTMIDWKMGLGSATDLKITMEMKIFDIRPNFVLLKTIDVHSATSTCAHLKETHHCHPYNFLEICIPQVYEPIRFCQISHLNHFYQISCMQGKINREMCSNQKPINFDCLAVPTIAVSLGLDQTYRCRTLLHHNGRLDHVYYQISIVPFSPSD